MEDVKNSEISEEDDLMEDVKESGKSENDTSKELHNMLTGNSSKSESSYSQLLLLQETP